MASSYNSTLKSTSTLLMAVVLLHTGAFVNANPSVEAIKNLAESAGQISDQFMQETFERRLRYEFSGEFVSEEDRRTVGELAQDATDRLGAIAGEQEKLKQLIEDYEGEDWDEKYGTTGLWRRLGGDIYRTRLMKCEIQFYLGLSARQGRRNQILHEILGQIEALDPTCSTAHAQLLKAKAWALLASTNRLYEPLAKREFDLLTERSDMEQSTAFRTAIERARFLGATNAGQLDELADSIAESTHADDIELALSLAFLQRRYQPEGFERTVQEQPQIEDFIGSCILSELSGQIEKGQFDPEKTTAFGAELATLSAWKNNPGEHTRLLEHLANSQELQTALILYVTAVALGDSAGPKGVHLLIEAGRLQQIEKSDRLPTSGVEIARQAAQLAYSLFVRSQCDCNVVLEAFENYCTTAEEELDQDLEYCYSTVLNNCGKTAKADKLLERIAGRPMHKWSGRARLDLIRGAIRERPREDQEARNRLLDQLDSLIADCADQNESDSKLRTEALTIYCQLLLECKDRDSAEEVLDVITEGDTDQDPNLLVFTSTALLRLGRLEESAHCLVKAMEHNRCEHISEAMEVLSETAEELDRFEEADIRFLENCRKLAQISYDCLEGQPQHIAALLLVEMSLFSATREENKLSAFEKLLESMAKEGLSNDVDLMRCRARLFAEQGKFAEAAALWAEVARMRKKAPGKPDLQTWKWWRAKYYELYCRSKCPQTDKQSLLHAIDVLENSFTAIPPLWAERIGLLKRQIDR